MKPGTNTTIDTAATAAENRSLEPVQVMASVHDTLHRHGAATDDLTITYTKHKPGHSTLIGFAGSKPQRIGHARRYDIATEADHAFTKACRMRLVAPTPLGIGVERVDPNTIVWGFPNDPVLRQLRWFTQARKLKRSFEHFAAPGRVRGTSTSRILAYKPQRRLVTRISLDIDEQPSQELTARYSAKPTAARLHRSADAFAAAGINVPRPAAVLLDGHVAVSDYLPGSPLITAARNQPTTTADAIDALLERLRTADMPRIGVIDEATIAARRRDELRQLNLTTGHAAPCAQALAAARKPSTRLRPAHGDLTLSNVLTTHGDLALIDLERSAWAPAPFDLATIAANAVAASQMQPHSRLDAFAQQLAAHGSARYGRATFNWHRATALIAIATTWNRQLVDTAHIESLLDTATTYLRATKP